MILFSLFLDGYLSKYYLFPFFTFVSLFFFLPKNKKRSYYFVFLIGMLYDLIYTTSFGFYTCFFLFINFISRKIKPSIFSLLLELFFYHICIFLWKRTNSTFSIFLFQLISSYFLNLVFLFLYLKRKTIFSFLHIR